ncbi:hypothetical protein Acid345_4088 [Candidatus Koribacter versatilis Ellin345]|uniref:Abnormal spindle-like microcephaly-associated protein ASH domain-containing protein n=1 Tax=Koribacter versatilis (strain Ellin345) TaxID=204669 RepID=Q1IJ62_KORVE|nr:choice-of-anchor D domain-containing protein [Candidatus Koribacter versatilis]ABF43088.1 hypothetical protein Acid345_4088 [Candidatus Koribacter versatilis Ellin345]
MKFRTPLIAGLASVLICTLLTGTAFARRRGDLPSSQNGPGTDTDCLDSGSTPYLAWLDGHSTSCVLPGDTTKSPITYPDLSASFSIGGNSIKITPIVWANGGFAGSVKTILQVKVVRPSGSKTTVTVNSLVLNQILTNPDFVACSMPSSANDDISTANGATMGACMTYRLMTSPVLTNANPTYNNGHLLIAEPDPVVPSDNTMTRWDFVGFTQDQTFFLVVDGVLNNSKLNAVFTQFQFDFTGFYNPLDLSASQVSISATVNGKSTTLGALAVPTSSAAPNDLTSTAIPVTAGGFTDYHDTANANPQPGNAATNQNDPVPPCFDGDTTSTDHTQVNHSVWYRIDPQHNGSAYVSTDGSRYDTRIYVFTVSAGSPVLVACNDDSTVVHNVQSDTTSFGISTGLVYWIEASEGPRPLGTMLDTNGDPEFDSGSNYINALVPGSPHPVLNFAVISQGLTPTPASVSFSNQTVNTTSSSRTITLLASGNDLNSISPSISGNFAISGGTCTSTLSYNTTCTITVTFKPTALGTQTGTLTVSSSGAIGPLKVPLSGTGVAVFTALPISMSFGNVYVGKNTTLSGAILNNSASSVSLSAPAIAPASTDFTLGTTTCGSSLPSHASCTFQVEFTPTSQRNENATLTYTSGANTASVSLRGSGLSALAVSSSTISFGSVTKNTSKMQTVFVTNNTAAVITLGKSIGPTGTAFSFYGGTCTTSLAAHAACTLGLVFKPTATGPQSANLVLSGGGYAAYATLSGTGQ